MPIFMDIHPNLGDVTEEDLKAAHQRDLEVQHKHGVQFMTYWFNIHKKKTFCLVDAPSAEAAVAAHKEAHGLMPHSIIQVDRPTVDQFMGYWEENVPNEARLEGPGSELDSGLRAIMFTDLEGSTSISSQHGDMRALEVLGRHDEIVRSALDETGGREVKHTGDGILSSFTYVSRAVECAMNIQREFAESEGSGPGGKVRIGISAGEPVSQSEDIFGAAVNLASRICGHADPGQILVSSAVKDLCIGKPFAFSDRGPIALKGFDEPVRLYEVAHG